MNRLVPFLFATLLAVALCGPAHATNGNAAPAGPAAGETHAKKPAGKSGKHPEAKKNSVNKEKKAKAQKQSRGAKKSKAKQKTPPKKGPTAPEKVKEPAGADKAGTVRTESPGRFSTPPPGTGYGSLEPESPPPTGRR